MKRLFATVIAVLTIAVAGAGSAFAANPTWLPAPDAISPNTSLYVSPAMHSRLNIDEAALAQKIAEQEARNGLHFRVVITQQGDDLSDATKSTWASDIEHNVLWNNFQTAGNFDESHTVLLLYIRSKADNSGSIAARSGSYLHSLNIGQEQFADANGPVLSAARRYIRSDVPAAVVAILSNINDAVTTAQAAAASPAADQPQPATGTPASDSDNSVLVASLMMGGVVLVVFIIVVGVHASERRNRERRERLASLSAQARSQRPTSYTPPSPPSYTPPVRRSSPPPRRSSGSSSSGRRSGGGGTNIFIGGIGGGSHHSSGGSRSSCGSSSSGSSSSSSCGSSSSSSSCGSSSSSSCGGSSSSCGGGGSV